MEENKILLKKQQIFRANICFLHLFYRQLLDIATAKTDHAKLVSLGDNCFYSMFGTNSSDLSKYKNGKLVKATRIMLKKTQECKPLYNAILGEKQLYPDIALTSWEKYYRVENRESIKAQIGQLTRNMFKNNAVLDKELMTVAQWISEKIKTYITARNSSSTQRIESAYSNIENFTFEDYDSCSFEDLDNARKIWKNQGDLLVAVWNYKKMKKK